MKLLLLYKHLKKESLRLLSEGLLEEYFSVIYRLENLENQVSKQLKWN